VIAPEGRSTRISRRRQHRRRRGRIVAGILAAALLVIGTAVGGTIAALAKTVTISVDGATRQVTTLAGDVDGALRAAGLAVGAHDTLAPAGRSAISDGSRILVQRGRLVTVTIDGSQRQFWTTATTVDAALAQLGRNAADFKLSADRSREIPLQGMSLTADTLHTVTLADRTGRSVQVTTAADSVADLLRERGIDLLADDAITPAVGTPLTDGLVVTVRRLPTVTLVDATGRHRLISAADSVADLLAAQGITVTAKNRVSPPVDGPLSPGLVITVTTLPTVTVADGAGKPVTVITEQPTVGTLLVAQKISPGKYDIVTPGLKTPLTEGMSVRVTRVSYSSVAKDVTVPQPADVVQYSDQMDKGRETISTGHPGTERVIYRIKTVNGKAGAPQEISRTTLMEAAATVKVIGTRTPPPTVNELAAAAPVTTSAAPTSAAGQSNPTTRSGTPSTAPSSPSSGVTWVGNQVFFHDFSYGVNWDGLAHCESTNNPRAVNPTGRYFGLFQFDLSTWSSVGGTGNPIDASPEEQLLRAKKLYLARGLSPWACAWAAH
jgi:uncharacterized protein YabE (DUF348 family)